MKSSSRRRRFPPGTHDQNPSLNSSRSPLKKVPWIRPLCPMPARHRSPSEAPRDAHLPGLTTLQQAPNLPTRPHPRRPRSLPLQQHQLPRRHRLTPPLPFPPVPQSRRPPRLLLRQLRQLPHRPRLPRPHRHPHPHLPQRLRQLPPIRQALLRCLHRHQRTRQPLPLLPPPRQPGLQRRFPRQLPPPHRSWCRQSPPWTWKSRTLRWLAVSSTAYATPWKLLLTKPTSASRLYRCCAPSWCLLCSGTPTCSVAGCKCEGMSASPSSGTLACRRNGG